MFSEDTHKGKETDFSGCLEELHVKGKDGSVGNPCLAFTMAVHHGQPNASCFSVALRS